MADTKAELEAQIAALQAEKAALKAKTEQYEAAINAGEAIAVPIEGTFTATLKSPKGPAKKVTVGFKAGHKAIRYKGDRVGTEAFMRLANGEELTEADYKMSPKLVGLTQEDAAAWMTDLVKMKYGYLEVVE